MEAALSTSSLSSLVAAAAVAAAVAVDSSSGITMAGKIRMEGIFLDLAAAAAVGVCVSDVGRVTLSP